METRHLVEGQFGSEFPVICNQARGNGGSRDGRNGRPSPFGRVIRKFLANVHVRSMLSPFRLSVVCL